MCLAMLLSSMFIYNHLSAIDEESLEQLAYIGNLCRNIEIMSGQKEVRLTDY